MLCSHGDETGIPGVKGQPVEHGDGTHHQGEPHIQAIGKGVACDPDPHGGVDGGQQDVQTHDPFFLTPLVDERRHQDGKDHIGQHAAYQDKGGQQGGLRLVEHQEANG